MAVPSRWSCLMAWRAAVRAAWCRRALAWVRKAELSARFIVGTVFAECFQGRDDPVQAGLDAAQVLGEPELAFGVGLSDEMPAGCGLPPVDLQEHGRGLEVGTGEAGVDRWNANRHCLTLPPLPGRGLAATDPACRCAAAAPGWRCRRVGSGRAGCAGVARPASPGRVRPRAPGAA